MTRPSRLEILEYALEGATMQRGTHVGCPDLYEEWLDELDAHIEWLESEIARVKRRQA